MDPIQVELYDDGAWIAGVDNYRSMENYMRKLEMCVLLDSVANL